MGIGDWGLGIGVDFEDKEKNNELKKDHQENTDDNSNDNFYKTLINDNTNNTN